MQEISYTFQGLFNFKHEVYEDFGFPTKSVGKFPTLLAHLARVGGFLHIWEDFLQKPALLV